MAIAVVLLFGHEPKAAQAAALDGWSLYLAGALAGLAIGIDIKLAGSLSLAVSLPTRLVGFARYSRDQSFAVLDRHKSFLVTMAAGQRHES